MVLPSLPEILLGGGVLVLALDKAHEGWLRHRAYVRSLRDENSALKLVTERECAQRRDDCRCGVDSRLADGAQEFDRMWAIIRILARKSGITSQEIEEEMHMIRQRREANA